MMYRNCSGDATAGAAKASFNDFSSLSGKPGSAAPLWRIATPTLPAIEFPKGPRPPQTGSLFHKSLAAQVREIVLHARGVAVVGKLGEITGGHDAKLADLGQAIRAGADNRLSLDNVEIQSWLLARAQLDALARAQRALGELEDAVQRPLDPGGMFSITPESPAVIGPPKDLKR